MQLVMFSKHLGPLTVGRVGELVRELGFDGVDLTVRPGGHVLPESVDTDLPDTVNDGTTVTITSFAGCASGSEVTGYLVVGGGHAWPGGLPLGSVDEFA